MGYTCPKCKRKIAKSQPQASIKKYRIIKGVLGQKDKKEIVSQKGVCYRCAKEHEKKLEKKKNEKSNLEIINENLPLIPTDIPMKEKVKLAKKKLKFVNENAGLFASTGSYVMTCASVKKELKSYEDALSRL